MAATGYRHCCLLKMLFWETVFQAAFMAHISELNGNNTCHHQRKHENTRGGGGGHILLLCLLKWVNLSFTAR